ncbi:retrotransposon protein, putative, ty1-copia subclass [Tanacetum coccineum]
MMPATTTKKVGHYKRNCPAYLAELIKKKKQVGTASSSDIFDYALESATPILNMVQTKKVDKTPYELWYVKVPNLSYLKETMGYYFYFPPENKIVVARYAEFFEKNLISQEVSGWAGELEEIQDEDTLPFENTSEIPIEMQSMKDNQVWCLVDLPPNGKTVGSKWILKKKTNMDDNVHTYKARLVAKGFTQTYGVDYEETFSPIADIRAIRILIAIAAFYDYEICQSAYMNKIKKSFKMDNSKCGKIPMQERLDLNKTQGASTLKEVKRMQNVPYASNPGEPYWTAVKTILKYLRNNKDIFLVYGRNPKAELRVDCYCDFGFETDRDDIKFQTVYVFILNGGVVDWKSSKQSTTTMSATEAEYIAALEAAMEAVFLENVATRWIKTIPIKVNVFAWKLHLDRLPTRSNLLKRGIQLFLGLYVNGGTFLGALLILIRAGWSGLILFDWAPSLRDPKKAFFMCLGVAVGFPNQLLLLPRNRARGLHNKVRVIFSWRARRDRLPTRVNLSCRGVLLDSHLCPLCNAAMEDVQHVFFRCDVAFSYKLSVGGIWIGKEHLFFLDLRCFVLYPFRLHPVSSLFVEVFFYVLREDFGELRNQLVFERFAS